MASGQSNRMHEDLAAEIFALGPFVRCVAMGRGQDVHTLERAGVSDASGLSLHRFEELFVNPALMTVSRQRGELDCGGHRYLVVAYGRFSQLIVPIETGYISISLEAIADVEHVAVAVISLLERYELRPEPRS
jgi:hypothetical protein